jgi:hypothetical protein
MRSTLDMNSGFRQISAALKYDDCEQALAEGKPLAQVYALAAARGGPTYNGPASVLVQTTPVAPMVAA